MISDIQIENNETTISYRKTCKDCNWESWCLFDKYTKMFNRRCYIDFMASKMKTTPKMLFKRMIQLQEKTDYREIWNHNRNIRAEWLEMSNRAREDYLKRYYDMYDLNAADIKLLVVFLNTYYDAWRDVENIACARCGKLIKNSKQYNRRFCEECRKSKRPKYKWRNKTCIDCGDDFSARSNRPCRCVSCQMNADRVSARKRAEKYRSKNNGLEEKS